MTRPLGSLAAYPSGYRRRINRLWVNLRARARDFDGIVPWARRLVWGRPRPEDMAGPVLPLGPERGVNPDDAERRLRNGESLAPDEVTWLVLNQPIERRTVTLGTDGSVLTASRIARQGRDAMSTALWAGGHRYANPHQDIEYLIIEACTSSTFWSAAMGTLMQLVMGKRIRPKLELIHETDDTAKDNETLEGLKWITDVMEENDRAIGPKPGDPVGRQSLYDTINEAVRCTKTYNRCAILINDRSTITVDGVDYPNMPSSLRFIHARDLGMVTVDSYGDLKSVYWNEGGRQIEWQDMIYLWNSKDGEDRRGTKWFGTSLADGVLLSLRTLYQVLAVDSPVAMKALYGGSAIVTVDVSALDPSMRLRETNRIASALRPGSVSVLAANPGDVDVKPINVDVKATEQEATIRRIFMEICAALKIPISILFDESASNRATLIGKLVFTMKGSVEPIRDWIDRELGAQWYGEQLEIICRAAGREDLLELVRVHVAFDDLNLESDEKVMESLSKLVQMVPLNDRAILNTAGFPELVSEIDEEKRARMEEMGAMPGMPMDDGGPGGQGGDGDSEDNFDK